MFGTTRLINHVQDYPLVHPPRAHVARVDAPVELGLHTHSTSLTISSSFYVKGLTPASIGLHTCSTSLTLLSSLCIKGLTRATLGTMFHGHM
jgi:hypothetical protein